MKLFLQSLVFLSLIISCKQASSNANSTAETATTTEVVATPKEFSEQMLADISIIEEYLSTNNLEAQKTASGLHYIIVEEGKGEKAVNGKTVAVHYRGTLMDGKQFDSSYDRNAPIDFKLGAGMVIRGWDEGIALLNVGSKAKLLIPSELAYGSKEIRNLIPANSVLIFDVELVSMR